MSSTIVIFTLIGLIESAKILVVVPTPSFSHQVVFRPLIQELIKRDHEVTIITTNPVYPKDEAPDNLTEIDVHDLSYKLFMEWFRKSENIDQDDFLSKLAVAYRVISKVFEEQLKDESVQELIRNGSMYFDLLIIEPLVKPALVFSHIFKAPVIYMSSFAACPGDMEMIGAPTHPFIYPMMFHRRLYNLTILEKLNELYQEILINQLTAKQEVEDDAMLQRLLGEDVPSLSELKKNVHMLFLNVHPIWVHNQPVPPNVVFTWGIHRTPEKTLPQDLLNYLDSSKNVIYMSFGTNFNTSSTPPETLKVLVKVLSRIPYNILLKWNADEFPGRPENIKTSKWLPQVDVLRHPNVKLFITQGGLQSTDEAIHAAVPLIGIPMIGDQQFNCEKYEHFKIGIKLNLKTLAEEQLENAINTIFKDYDSYKKNIVQLRTIMQDTPKPPMENAIWWIEYVLRHGGARQLQAPAANMHWTEYFELQLVSLLVVGLLVVVVVLLLLTYSIFKFFSRILQAESSHPRVKTKVS